MVLYVTAGGGAITAVRSTQKRMNKQCEMVVMTLAQIAVKKYCGAPDCALLRGAVLGG
jgi:hypothetical protein